MRPPSHADPALRQHRSPSARALLSSLLRPSRFAVVGVVGLAVNIAAFVFCTELLGMHYALAAIVAFQVSTLNNFILTDWGLQGTRGAPPHRRPLPHLQCPERGHPGGARAAAGAHHRMDRPGPPCVERDRHRRDVRHPLLHCRELDMGRARRAGSVSCRRLVRLRHPRPGAPELADRPAGAGRVQHPGRRRAGHRHRPALRPGWPAATAGQHRLR